MKAAFPLSVLPGPFTLPASENSSIRNPPLELSSFKSDLPTRDRFDDNTDAVIMIVGDCIVAEDDDLWQSKEFDKIQMDNVHGINMTGNTPLSEPVLIPWFDPPLISPQPSVCAVPVSPRSLDYAFREVFGRKIGDKCRKDSDYRQVIESEVRSSDNINNSGDNESKANTYLRCCTPVSASAFSVLTYSSHVHLQPTSPLPSADLQNEDNLQNRAQVDVNPITYPRFGPNDFCTMRELLLIDCPPQRPIKKGSEKREGVSSICVQKPTTTNGKIPRVIADVVSLDFLWEFIMPFASIDSLLFMELRWVLLHKIKELAFCPFSMTGQESHRKNDQMNVAEEVTRWSEAALKCCRCHSCLSLPSLLSFRAQTVHWLLSLGSSLWKLYNEGAGSSKIATCSQSNPFQHEASGSEGDMKIQSQLLLIATVSALRSCLTLLTESEMLEGLGVTADAVLHTLHTATLNTSDHSSTPSFCHSIRVPHLLWQQLLGAEDRTFPAVFKFLAGTTVLMDQEEKGGCSMQVFEVLHLQSAEEAIHCAMAIRLLQRIFSANAERRNLDISSEGGSPQLGNLAKSILEALQTHYASGCPDRGKRSKMQRGLEKMSRKAERMLYQLNTLTSTIFSTHIGPYS